MAQKRAATAAAEVAAGAAGAAGAAIGQKMQKQFYHASMAS